MEMWNGRKKAFTLSYDDGVESDRKLLDIINYYRIKCTFNLNSGLIGDGGSWKNKDFEVRRLPLEGLRELYAGHEIAVHGTKHLAPPELGEEELEEELLGDKERLGELFGTEPIGMAYAYGAFDDRTVDYLASIGIKYARTVWDSMNFDLQTDLLRFRPTCHHDNEKVFELLDEFVNKPGDEPRLFYLWGHSYEFDVNGNWERLEKICERVAGRDDIFFGTNKEVLLN